MKNTAIAAWICATANVGCAYGSPVAPALTIYNQNFAVVRDTVPMDLTAGVNHISYAGITSQVEPDSVILRDPAGKRLLTVLEQNYRGETVSQGLLLSLNEGKTIDFEVPGVNGGPPSIVRGTIVRSGYNEHQSDTPMILVNGKLEFALPGKPLFPALTDDSILTPTLEWTLDTDRSGPLDAELAYVTEGITWKASYNIVASAATNNLDMTAWVTIKNECGKDFDNAKIKLMAGDVNKIMPNKNDLVLADVPIIGSLFRDRSSAMATQKGLDDYHLYTLPNATTLRNHETKQVEFMHAGKIASKEIYIYDGLILSQDQYAGWDFSNIRNQRAYGTTSNTKVAIEREFMNNAANGLGVPLPAGRVRFYMRDDEGQLEFLGEDDIDHTPQDEPVKIVTGDAFDIVGSRTQTSYEIDNSRERLDESFTVTLDNHKLTPVVVEVIEHLYRGQNWSILASSDHLVKKDANSIEFDVQVLPGVTKTVTYTAHYTW